MYHDRILLGRSSGLPVKRLRYIPERKGFMDYNSFGTMKVQAISTTHI